MFDSLLPTPGPKVIKLFPCSTQLSTKFILLINVKMPRIDGILTFISMINTTSERLKARNFVICWYFSFYEQLKFRAQLSWAWKYFHNIWAWPQLRLHWLNLLFSVTSLATIFIVFAFICKGKSVSFVWPWCYFDSNIIFWRSCHRETEILVTKTDNYAGQRVSFDGLLEQYC